MSKRTWIGFVSLFAAGSVALGLYALWAPVSTEAQGQGPYSYPVKFVCGFNPTNTGPITPPWFTQNAGENVVKLGNYATDINIYNPSPDKTANITKKIAVLAKALDAGFDIFNREPKTTMAISDGEILPLGPMAATMDDCNELYRRAGMPNPATPPPLLVGFLILLSDIPLDVTSVYTSEICADWVQGGTGGTFMCASISPGTGGGFWGAGISIDVEQVRGRDLSINTP